MKKALQAGIAGAFALVLLQPLSAVAQTTACGGLYQAPCAPSTTAAPTTSSSTTSTTQAPGTTIPRQPASTAPPTTTAVTVRPPFVPTTVPGPTTTAPPAAVIKAEADKTRVQAGDALAVVSPASATFDADTQPTVILSGVGNDATTVQPQVTATVDDDGQLQVDVVVPAGTPEQILILTISAVDARGQTRTMVVLFTVTSRPSGRTESTAPPSRRSADTSVATFQALPVVPVSEVPALVRQLQASVPDDETEARLVEGLAADENATLVVNGAQLALSTDPFVPQPADDSRPLVAALAVAVAGGGLLSFRRRFPTTVKGSR